MFTGIIEEKGTVEAIIKQPRLFTLTIKAPKVSRGTQAGESISVDGVCLTVKRKPGSSVSFDVMKATLKVTTLGLFKIGQKVNLERALRVSDRLSGHFVTGHVDVIGTVEKIIKKKNEVEFVIRMPASFRRFLVPKGSVCVDGVSLTVGKVAERRFSVYLIPYTVRNTTFHERKEGDPVNIEIDILAKYALQEKGE